MTEVAVLKVSYLGYDVDVTGDSEWSMNWEERTDGSPGQFSAVIQDRTNTALYGVTQRDHVNLALSPSGFVLYDGEIVNSKLDLPVGMPWGRWNLSGSDWNTIPDLRLVGTPSGTNWVSIDGGLTFQAVDGSAHNASDDAVTIANLFSAYVAVPYFVLDTSTYVGKYIPNSILNNPHSGDPQFEWTHVPLRSALDDMRSIGSQPIFLWIDPDGAVHWQVFQDTVVTVGGALVPFTQGLLSMMLPEGPPPGSTFAGGGSAPAILTDIAPDGITSIGCRALSFSFDATYMPEQVWVNGTTDYIYNYGAGIAQGTGFGDAPFEAGDPTARQISVDAQSASVAQRLAVGAAYRHFGARARIKITATFAGRPDEQIDGWRCGQTVTIVDSRLPAALNGLTWTIHRVAGKVVPGHPELRTYTIECGDAAIGRFYAKYRTSPKTITAPRKPAYTWEVYFTNLHPAVGEVQTLVLQLMDSAKNRVRASGIPGNLSFLDPPPGDGLGITLAGAPVTSDATLSPTSVTTNADGQAAVTFTTDSAQAGLRYPVYCATPAQ